MQSPCMLVRRRACSHERLWLLARACARVRACACIEHVRASSMCVHRACASGFRSYRAKAAQIGPWARSTTLRGPVRTMPSLTPSLADSMRCARAVLYARTAVTFTLTDGEIVGAHAPPPARSVAHVSRCKAARCMACARAACSEPTGRTVRVVPCGARRGALHPGHAVCRVPCGRLPTPCTAAST